MRIILLLLLIICSLLGKAQQNNTDALRKKSLTLRRFLEQNHYKPLQWDDAGSVRLYDHWMELLDDEKLLFSKTEIDLLFWYSTRLDDEMMGKDWSFFDKSIGLYKIALVRTDSIIKAITDKPLDFSKADVLNWPLPTYPANSAGVYQTWQQYLKWRVLHTIADAITDSSDKNINYTTLPINFDILEIKARADIRKQELLWIQNKLLAIKPPGKEMEDAYLSAISWCYDPHTEYMSADAKTDFDTEMSGLEFSIGFEIDENKKGEWVITYLVPGGPAWRSGELHKGDVLLKVKSGDKPELILANGSIQQLNKILEGSGNEKITITVRTASGAQKKATLTREKITNEDGIVKSYILKGTKKIGYITLPGFYVKEGDEENINGCSNDVAKEVVKLKKDSIAGLILDVRFNGGGSLGEALELAGIFINDGPLTSTKDKSGKIHFLRDPNRGTIYDGPLLIMVNTFSASASELVSAVLQDYHRALIVGSATYGKGSAQVILPMDTSGNFSATTKYNSYVKVTDEKFYRVDGSTTQWKGVIPDIELPDIYAIDKLREKGVISALQPDSSKPAMYQPLAAIPISMLKLKSNERLNATNNFKVINQSKEWFKNIDRIKNIPLQWAAYINYYKINKAIYTSIENDNTSTGVKAFNNSLDKERQKLITVQSKAINEVNINRIEKDKYIAESFKIMEDWLK